MKIEFKKVSFAKKDFKIESDSVAFEGTFNKIAPNLVEIDAVMDGSVEIQCDRCGKDYELELNGYPLQVIASDGIYSSDSDMSIAVVEFFDGLIDFESIYIDELVSIKSDYHICKECSLQTSEFEIEF